MTKDEGDELRVAIDVGEQHPVQSGLGITLVGDHISTMSDLSDAEQ